jgi:hypothetical protein
MAAVKVSMKKDIAKVMSSISKVHGKLLTYSAVIYWASWQSSRLFSESARNSIMGGKENYKPHV